jgi:hypothetical protein
MGGDSATVVRSHVRSVGRWFLRATGSDPRVTEGGMTHQILSDTLRSIDKYHTAPARNQSALTIDVYRIFRRHLFRLDIPATDALMYDAALQLSIFGLLRIGRVTSPTQTSFDPKSHARRRDITLVRNGAGKVRGLSFYLVRSKTDRKGRGTSVPVWSTGQSSICAVRAMTRYLRATRNRSPGKPLFRLSSGRYLTYGLISKMIKTLASSAGFDPDLYATHSCRRGGAVTLAHTGADGPTIKLHGRWARGSDCFLRYLGLTEPMVKAAARRMARVGPLSAETRASTWQRLEAQQHAED